MDGSSSRGLGGAAACPVIGGGAAARRAYDDRSAVFRRDRHYQSPPNGRLGLSVHSIGRSGPPSSFRDRRTRCGVSMMCRMPWSVKRRILIVGPISADKEQATPIRRSAALAASAPPPTSHGHAARRQAPR